MNKLVLGGVLLLAAAGVVALFVSGPAQTVAERRGGPVPVVVAPVVEGEFATVVESVGTARANESVDVSAKVTETVARVAFRDGQRVQAGELLVQLSDARQRAELQEAEVDVAEQEREYRRLLGLVRQKAIPESQLDAQRSRLEAARARLQAARTNLADRRITAPFEGVVGLRRVSPGALVEPGDVLTTLDDIDPIKLDFTVPETFFAALGPGQPVQARATAYPGRIFEGVVESVDSRIDPVTRAVAVRALIPNPDGELLPGMLLTVHLVTDRRRALILPEAAVVPLGDKQYVFVVGEDNKARRVAVELGRRRPGEVEVLSGLEPGQKVVVEGTIRLKPGAEVRIAGEAGATG